MDLKNGLNPEQHATATVDAPGSPVRVLWGHPSLINLLDGVGAWRLVREAASVLAMPAATSVKHVSPAGAAVAGPLDSVMAQRWIPDGVEPSPITTAYVRARDCDPKSSFGDFVAVSEPVDYSLAEVLRGVVSDGIIAPGYEPGTIDVLAAKKGGRYLILEVGRPLRATRLGVERPVRHTARATGDSSSDHRGDRPIGNRGTAPQLGGARPHAGDGDRPAHPVEHGHLRP